jgi:hypothetical protein
MAMKINHITAKLGWGDGGLRKIKCMKLKQLSFCSKGVGVRKKGPQNDGISRDVDENKGPVFRALGLSRHLYEK